MLRLALALLLLPSLALAQVTPAVNSPIAGCSEGSRLLWSGGGWTCLGALPSVSACGTVPNGSVTGSDRRGTIAVGGGVVTSCTLTFGGTYSTPLSCALSTSSAAVVPGSTVSTTQLVATLSVSLGGGKIFYSCGP